MVDVRCVESSVQEILSFLETSPQGISKEEAFERLEKYGRNTIATHERESIAKIFISQFKSPLVGLLLFAALLSLFLGEVNEAMIIGVVVLVNAVIGTYHEVQALSSIDALKKLVRQKTKVFRDNSLMIIDSEELVPGDVILLSEGDKVPADVRLIESKSIMVDESTLTGEPLRVAKSPEALKGASHISEMSNMLFAGTLVVSGEGKAVVCSTGSNTILGRVYRKLSAKEIFPAHQKLSKFSNILIKAVGIGFLLILLLGFFSGHGLFEMFNLAVAQAVSFIPEGLPIVVTVALSVSAYDMAKRKAVVRKLEAMEAIGQANFLCIDKTGTLTKNELRLAAIALDGAVYHLTDKGAELEGRQIDPAEHQDLLKAMEAASLSAIVRGESLNIGDPLDVAIVKTLSSLPLSVNPSSLLSLYVLKEESPFDFKTKRTCRKYQRGDETFIIFKGAPELIIEESTHMEVSGKIKKLGKKEKEALSSHLQELTSQGYRVVGLSKKQGTKMFFVAFLCFWDDIRKDAESTVKELKKSGVKVLMITGDHKLTAKAVAKKVGLGSRVLDQQELFSLPKEEQLKALHKAAGVSRATIEGKLHIIELLRKEGNIVAMTGDGVNDAAALREAHVGISLASGTDVAKEASDIMLLDDSIKTLEEALQEGRRSIINIIKTIRYLLTTNMTEVLFLFSSLAIEAIGFAFSFPLRAMHILYVNLVTDGLCDVAIATEKREKEMKDKPPSFFQGGYSTPDMVAFILVGSITSLFILLGVSYLFEEPKTTTAALTTLVFLQLWTALSSRKLSWAFDAGNRFLLLSIIVALSIHMLVIFYPPLSSFMGVVPLELGEVVSLFAISSVVFLFLEATKIFLPLLRLAYK